MKELVRYLIGRPGSWLLLVFCLLAGSASAQVPAPDPITFGFAVERGDLRTVTRWLDEGLDPEYQAAQIGTGLMVAAWNGNIEMMALFVARGADPRRSNRNGEQPLQLAAWGGHIEAVKWLLEHGAPLERQGNNWGALHYAVFNGHQQLVEDLIARGANVNARSPNQSTPLILAAREGRDGLARLLLEAGANTKLQNDWGDTPLTMAMRYDHLRLAKMISSPEEFEIAVKKPKESFGEAVRSAAVPSEIDEILKQIRAAEAEGKPSQALHRKLLATSKALRASSESVVQRPMPRPYMPPSMVITARRGRPGAERAQLMVEGKPAEAAATAGTTAKATKPTKEHSAAAAKVSDLLRQIRLTEAQGQSADTLRQELYQAVAAMQQ
ncbi:ankyrin repeat domain-containing protein [Accumulibacter sp.]|uniref:ankyrin repeat domain-containing protein n=1 Tax=Accumulibacter sp. TaxID=2053492 RepID=UPI0028C45F8B|nr:ankyrin repeat domain-containing protein [Accumulibacter sp.]